MKQNNDKKNIFQTKTYKILSIISFAFNLFFSLLIVLSCVKCSNTDNEYLTSNNITNVKRLNTPNNDYLFSWGETIVDNITCGSYFTGSISGQTLYDTLEKIQTSSLLKSRVLISIWTDNSTYLFRSSDVYSFVLDSSVSTLGFNFSAFDVNDSQISSTQTFTYSASYNMAFACYTPKTYVNNRLTSYFAYMGFTDNENHSNENNLTFDIPPYINIDKSQSSFYYSCSFTYNNERYYGFNYEYHTLFQFDGTPALDFDMTLSSDNNYLFNIPVPNNTTLLPQPTLTLLVVSTGVIDFLTNTFIPSYDSYYSATMSIKYGAFMNYFLDSSTFDFTTNFLFTSNGERFEGVRCRLTGGKIFLDYIQNGGGYLNIIECSYYVVGGYVEYTKNLTEYKDISFSRIPITRQVFNILTRYFTIDTSATFGGTSSGDFIGSTNIFSLLGSAILSLTGLFSLSILPGLSLGVLLFIPFVVFLVIYIVNLFRS